MSQHPFTSGWCPLISRELKVVKTNPKAIVSILSRQGNNQGKDSLNSQFAWLISITVFLISLTCLLLPLSSDGNCVRMVQLGVIHQLLDLLEKHVESGDVSVQHAALSALRNLAIPGTEFEDNWHTVILCKDGSLNGDLCSSVQVTNSTPLYTEGQLTFPPPQRHIYLNNSSGLLIYIKGLNIIKCDLIASCWNGFILKAHSSSRQKCRTRFIA